MRVWELGKNCKLSRHSFILTRLKTKTRGEIWKCPCINIFCILLSVTCNWWSQGREQINPIHNFLPSFFHNKKNSEKILYSANICVGLFYSADGIDGVCQRQVTQWNVPFKIIHYSSKQRKPLSQDTEGFYLYPESQGGVKASLSLMMFQVLIYLLAFTFLHVPFFIWHDGRWMIHSVNSLYFHVRKYYF